MSGEDPRDGSGSAPVTDHGFRLLLEKLSSTYNFDFREYKEASLARLIRVRMRQVRAETFESYIQYLEGHPQEHIALFNTILINVTAFLRDPEAWEVLSGDVLPRLISDAAPSRSIRIWSAGCSSGEEAYTVAILLAAQLGERANDYMIKVYGTDIDEDALSTARHAAYRLDQLKDLPDALIDRYFNRDGQLYRVRRDLRRWCIFGSHNLVQAPPLSHIDLLVCRNVLIYFTGELQERVIARFHYALRPGGALFLGRSESLLARSRLFAPAHLKWRIFVRTPHAAQQPTAVLPDRAPDAMGPQPDGREVAPGPARLQAAVDALPAAVAVIDMSDTIVSWNAVAQTLFEVPVAGAVGRKFRDLDISYRVEGLRARIEDVKARHAPLRLDDATFARRNGELTHADISIIPITDGARPAAIVVFALEASDHVRLKEQISRIAEQHATAIEELQSTNEELETTNEELQSTNEELETTVEELQATNAELATLNGELEHRTAELRRLDVRHQSLLNGLDQGISMFDRSGTIETWNQAAERLWGLRAEQVVGRHLGHLPFGNQAAAAVEAFDRVLRTAQAIEVPDVPYTLPGGMTRRARLRLSALKDTVGEVIGVMGILTPEETARAPVSPPPPERGPGPPPPRA